MTENFEIGIPYPPDEIFKFRKNIRQPAMKQLEEPNVTYIPEDIRYILGGGIFVYYQGVPFPTKGHVFPEAMYAVNQVKRIVINGLKIVANKDMLLPMMGFILSNKKKVLNRVVNSFIDTVDFFILKPYYLEDGYYAKATKEVRTFIRESANGLGIDQADLLGEILSLAIQYDNAYYFRLIDIMSETSKERLLNDFGNEVGRLSNILIEREFTNGNGINIAQTEKYKSIERMAKVAWFIPSIRRAIKKGLDSVNFENLQMDEADKYHSLLMGDYNYQGKDLESRIKEYIDYHGGEDKLPPRIAYRPV